MRIFAVGTKIFGGGTGQHLGGGLCPPGPNVEPPLQVWHFYGCHGEPLSLAEVSQKGVQFFMGEEISGRPVQCCGHSHPPVLLYCWASLANTRQVRNWRQTNKRPYLHTLQHNANALSSRLATGL